MTSVLFWVSGSQVLFWGEFWAWYLEIWICIWLSSCYVTFGKSFPISGLLLDYNQTQEAWSVTDKEGLGKKADLSVKTAHVASSWVTLELSGLLWVSPVIVIICSEPVFLEVSVESATMPAGS